MINKFLMSLISDPDNGAKFDAEPQFPTLKRFPFLVIFITYSTAYRRRTCPLPFLLVLYFFFRILFGQ